ncbi:hypothetical protein AB0H76_19890 [Nocardia sp. NPDC050712]|uniref:hypothetical protein n=1 Tax=Nocardia sp. NPDC050712 TaxID=3155518 RepID=UPI0033DCF7B2
MVSELERSDDDEASGPPSPVRPSSPDVVAMLVLGLELAIALHDVAEAAREQPEEDDL